MSFFKSWRAYSALSKETGKKIVFYSEGRSFWINFKAIIKSLVEDHGQRVYYVTSSADDPVLNQAGDTFRPLYIGSEFFRILLFKTLEADIFLATLQDIGSFHLQRPPKVKKMVYVHHASGSMNMVFRPGAFDGYDVVTCSGPHQIQEIREMETFYNTSPKMLIEAGHPPLDDLLLRLEAHEIRPNEKTTVTIAPSWHPENIIDRVAGPLIQSLLAADFTVRLRPHPRTWQKEPKKIEALKAEFGSEQYFQLDNSPGNFDSYVNTDLMVTDWSGTGFKFAFARLRPVLFINTPPKIRNRDYCLFKNVPAELSWRKIVGCDLDEDQAHLAGATARRLLGEADFSARLEKFRNEKVFNLGRSGEAVARAVVDILAADQRERI